MGTYACNFLYCLGEATGKGRGFILTDQQEAWYYDKGLSLPQACPQCIAWRKSLVQTEVRCVSCHSTRLFTPEEIAGFHKLKGISFAQVRQTFTCSRCNQNWSGNSQTGDRRGQLPKLRSGGFSTLPANQVFQPGQNPDLFEQYLIDKLDWFSVAMGNASRYTQYLRVEDVTTGEVLIIDPKFFAQAAMTYDVLQKFEGKHSVQIDNDSSKFLAGLDLRLLLQESLVLRINECRIIRITSKDHHQRVTFPSFMVQLNMGRVIGYDSNQKSKPAQILNVFVSLKGKVFSTYPTQKFR